ncbi:hypothetical protein PVAP13_5KG470107 [Panicum virgatum]|uniref:Uncharacterized protein n=1 Tax=Panicum virgatum TaxID=38727 RepID=A0A8T0STU4_PANVG|nr:hypothetical protein PVAP13_5KG470107 [Panicum virgatum]
MGDLGRELLPAMPVGKRDGGVISGYLSALPPRPPNSARHAGPRRHRQLAPGGRRAASRRRCRGGCRRRRPRPPPRAPSPGSPPRPRPTTRSTTRIWGPSSSSRRATPWSPGREARGGLRARARHEPPRRRHHPLRPGPPRRRHPRHRARRRRRHAAAARRGRRRGGRREPPPAAASTRGRPEGREVVPRRLLRLDAARRHARHARPHGRLHRLLRQGARDPDGRARRPRSPGERRVTPPGLHCFTPAGRWTAVATQRKDGVARRPLARSSCRGRKGIRCSSAACSWATDRWVCMCGAHVSGTPL